MAMATLITMKASLPLHKTYPYRVWTTEAPLEQYKSKERRPVLANLMRRLHLVEVVIRNAILNAMALSVLPCHVERGG